RTTVWKSVAGVAGALGLVLGGAGIAGAATVAPSAAHASASTASDGPMPDCHSAEHAGLGAIINCQNQGAPGPGGSK
ncbi:MAG TPA: hypothetical protein VHL53_08205, partial [Acidimicrobiia bacterium]|nr:hypothetical protein [Acidimicrobiia bacterium]